MEHSEDKNPEILKTEDGQTIVGNLEQLDKAYEEMLASNASNTDKARLDHEYKQLRRQYLGVTAPLTEEEKINRRNMAPKRITKKEIKAAKNWLLLYKLGKINCDDDPSMVQRMQKIAFTKI